MPEWLVVIILGVIEGVTEFLPVSSTGHLLLAQHWLHPRQSDLFNVVIQCGAVLAVLVAFTERIRKMIFEWKDPATRDFTLKLLAAFAVTCVGALVLRYFSFALPDRPHPVAWATLIGGVLILIIERWLRGRTLVDHISWTVALAVGAGQLLAIVFPGTSRSGATILMALALGLNRRAATEFSFLLGIPTLLSAGALEISSALRENTESYRWELLLLGTTVAAITAFLTVKWLLRYVQSHTFNGFGWYRIFLGIAILLLIS